MLPKKNRLTRKEVGDLFKDGKSTGSPSLALKFKTSTNKIPTKISVSVPKKIARTAVKRNLLRRQAYTVLQKIITSLPEGFMGVVIFRQSPQNIAADLAHLFKKI